MGRPRTTGDEFSHADLAAANGMTKRAVQQLADASPRLLPEGKGTNVFKRVATIGAFVSGGVPLIGAARLASLLPDCFSQPDGEVPSMLGNLLMGAKKELPQAAWDAFRVQPSEGDFYLHEIITRFWHSYPRGHSMPQDAIIEIVDREHVFLRQLNDHGIPVMDAMNDGRDYIARIEGWERGSEPTLIPACELMIFDRDHPNYAAQRGAFETMREDAWAKRVAVLSVNVSLAIRNAFDRLHQSRKLAVRS